VAGPIEGYRDSVYRELKALIDAPVTPMLKPARTVRTLILPYADRQRPDRLYMPRYVYSVLDKPVWVVAGGLVSAPDRAVKTPVLDQTQTNITPDGDPAVAPPPPSAPGREPMP
jgi:conjugal transfer pilus assembly protein TraV